MFKSIFYRECRSGLAVDATVPLIFMAIFAAPTLKAQLAPVITKVLSGFIVPIVVALGFAAGERCFSSTFKNTSLFLLSGLPIARSKVWLAIISARFFASLAALGFSAGSLALVARKANFGLSSAIKVYATVLLVFLASYFFGGIGALLIRRTLARISHRK